PPTPWSGLFLVFELAELVERLTRRHVRHSILTPWVSTKGIAGSRMQGLQRTRASALYTRLSVLPRFSFRGNSPALLDIRRIETILSLTARHAPLNRPPPSLQCWLA